MPIDDAIPEGDAARRQNETGSVVSIGLPDTVAQRLAGQRPIVSLAVKDIHTAGLDRQDNVEIGCLLLGGDMDALDIITNLGKAGFCGVVTVFSPLLPNPRMVERELRSAGKAMTVRLVVR
ncbi:MAG: hypothetical protein U0934_20065 [Pseudotabrizicola sp.]|uniref:hypothetical protein n=1 Tax=Pseudotabrizicola sp. TaxID=2939647 RepID=UPI00272746ED|nr:hypothetical protein [Pseudotabrizicola sp.]MDO8884413.1 hypothetical protein [Pseudotabrizicola sp.]MDP2082803.1 hypothetical protein [Pseudotabrizicola sp.]MDZ7576224.1 hypothetical protein [Pseudotabrizicola sp.]